MLYTQAKTDLLHYLAICHTPQMGSKKLMDLFSQFNTMAELLGSEQFKRLKPNYTLAEADLTWQQENTQHHIVTWFDPEYPELLRQIAANPPVLYAKGDLSLLKTTQIAVVGSRNPSASGLMNAQTLSTALSLSGYTITSGLALGIDAKAHQAVLAANGKTIAVLGTGLNHIYPRSHLKLAEQIAHTGLLVSEFAVNTSPRAAHFPQRNRIISGLSLGVLVVEAALKSGSLITARYALEQNREIFAIPGTIHNPLAQGCHALIRQGAKLVENVQDILEELPQMQPLAVLPCIKPQQMQVSALEQRLLNLMQQTPTPFDYLVEQTELTAPQLAATLTQLEVRGLIRATPCGYTPYLEHPNETQCA